MTIDNCLIKKSYVICGFPGTGKSYYKEHGEGSDYMPNGFAVDSDSSDFSKKTDWPLNYINHIKEEIEKGTARIFVSSHKVVREALFNAKIPFILVYPELILKNKYLESYKERIISTATGYF